MAFLTESVLREKASKFQKFASASYEYFSKSTYQAQITVFLSHSHKDKELVEGLIELLAEQGIYIYVDWNDSSMPRITSAETAKKIKGRIKEMDLFFFLATENGLNSKWCPWELGIADSLKYWGKIVIVPVADESGYFKGNEYLQIYQHLELTVDKFPFIVRPTFSETGYKYLPESIIRRERGVSLKEFFLTNLGGIDNA